MRTAIPVVVVLVVATLLAFVLVSRNDAETYRVRAIFDNAGFIIPGEDVKVAGVKVGTVDDVAVTPEFKAAVVLRIDDPGYQDFRADAHCMVRPQSLIGERFVECEPTAKHAVGQEAPGPLGKIDDGPGQGQYLLPVENTGKAVDLDLLNNIMREPERARLSIILNELGVGLAGRGTDLQRGDPARRPGAQERRPADPAAGQAEPAAQPARGRLGHDHGAARARSAGTSRTRSRT